MLDKNNKYMDDKLSGDYAFFKKKNKPCVRTLVEKRDTVPPVCEGQ